MEKGFRPPKDRALAEPVTCRCVWKTMMSTVRITLWHIVTPWMKTADTDGNQSQSGVPGDGGAVESVVDDGGHGSQEDSAELVHCDGGESQ